MCKSLTHDYSVGATGRSPLQVFQTSDVSKHPLSFGRAVAFCSSTHFEHKFFRHRMSGRHPMSNRDEFCLGNEIGFAIIISRRSEKLFAPTTKHNFQPLHHHQHHQRRRPMCLLRKCFGGLN